MSRSEKHVPIIKGGGYGKQGKKWANKRVRHNDIGDHCSYKKIYNQYDIFDYRFNLYRTIKVDGIPSAFWSNRLMTINEIMEYWRK